MKNIDLAVVALCLGLAGCGGGKNTSDGDAGSTVVDAGTIGPIRIAVPVAERVTNIALVAGVPRQDVFVERVPTEYGIVESATIDFAATLPGITITRTDSGTDPTTLEMAVGVQAGDHGDTVCDVGTTEGSATFEGDASFGGLTVDPPSLSASASTLDALNSGTVSVCLTTTASADALITISELVLEVGLRINCDQAPADMTGIWSGTYSCESTPECGGEGGDITLTVAQDGFTGAYWDSEAFYLGTVCGEVFSYRGRGPGYDEYGTLTLTGTNSAEKRSTYTSDDGCAGTCVDFLTRD